MLNRLRSRPYDPPEPPPPTSIKTLHETIMAKLGEQLRKRYEPAQQLPPEMLRLIDRLHGQLDN
jgi:hypothetical protein